MPKRPELSDEDAELRRDFGERLRLVRESLTASPGEFAVVGGISLAHQYRLESGERTADVLYVQRLMRRYGAQYGGLLLGLDAPSDQSEREPTSSRNINQANTGHNALQVVGGGKTVVKTRSSKAA